MNKVRVHTPTGQILDGAGGYDPAPQLEPVGAWGHISGEIDANNNLVFKAGYKVVEWDGKFPDPRTRRYENGAFRDATPAERDEYDAAQSGREADDELEGRRNPIVRRLARFAFNAENRLRALEGKRAVTWKQFKATIGGQ